MLPTPLDFGRPLAGLALALFAGTGALAQTPTVDSIAPADASSPGPVTVTGTALGATSVVTVSGVPVDVLSATPTQLVLDLPPQDPGFADVTVTTAGGQAGVPGGLELWPALSVSTNGLGGTVDTRLALGDAGFYILVVGTELLAQPVPILPFSDFGLLLDLSQPNLLLAQGVAPTAAPTQASFLVPTSSSLLGTVLHFQAWTQQSLLEPVEFSFSNAASVVLDQATFGPPVNLTYASNPVSYVVGQAIAPNLPTVDGLVEGFSVVDSPVFGYEPLPAGLALDAVTGAIVGTPTTAAPAQDFLLAAFNAVGVATTTISIEVLQDSPPPPVGTVVPKPGGPGVLDGGAFIVDPNDGGTAPAMALEEMYWGRLVDVYDTVLKPWVTEAEYLQNPLDPDLFVSRLVYPDFVVGEYVGTEYEGGELVWELFTHPVTGEDRLRISADAEQAAALFALRVAEAEADLTPVAPKGVGPMEIPPFTQIPRNAALVVRFDDLIDESTIGAQTTVQVLGGTPPVVPLEARIFADPNHGGIAPLDGAFHSTRLIVDFTISEEELAASSEVLSPNGTGLPASANSLDPSVAFVLPTQLDFSVGQFALLTNVGGGPVDSAASGPVDPASTTQAVAWALRAGNADDPNGGFLADSRRPTVVGANSVLIATAGPLSEHPSADLSLILVSNDAACFFPAFGDIVQVSPSVYFEIAVEPVVLGPGTAAVDVAIPFGLGAVDPGLVTGVTAQLLTSWRSELDPSVAPCFVDFSAATGPGSAPGVDPDSDLIVRFNEPIARDSARPFDSFYVARGADVDATLTLAGAGPGTPPGPGDLVLGGIAADGGARELRFAPTVPLTHALGQAENYFFNVVSSAVQGGVGDLAGNPLGEPLPQVAFALDPGASSQDTGGWVLRFNSTDEDDQPGPEIRGQILFDMTDGRIRPRPVQRFSAVIDRNQPVVGAMQAIPTGVQTPLSPLGSKAQLLWRYMDAGFDISQTDDLFYNVDVEGLALSPIGGFVSSDSYTEFEMLLGHAANLPDETVDPLVLLPKFPQSGFGSNATFAQNYLGDPAAGPVVVHPRELGFVVSSADAFVAATGTLMLPMPWNRGVAPEDKTFFTWRDTAVQTYGNLNGMDLVGGGVPTEQEISVGGLMSTPGDVFGQGFGGVVPTPTGVPAPGLPLLMEYRCFPSEGLGLNNFDVSIASTSSPRPFFRAFSTGGLNTSGLPIVKHPDDEESPTGGFNGNPLSGMIGEPTLPRDPSVYIGQMDLVTRVSRAHTVLVDAEQDLASIGGGAGYDYVTAVVEPAASQQPAGTAVIFAWRGENVAPTEAMTNANFLDVFGEPIVGPLSGAEPLSLPFPWADPSWHDTLAGVDGKRFVQTRITFVGNAATEETASLDAYGLAFYR